MFEVAAIFPSYRLIIPNPGWDLGASKCCWRLFQRGRWWDVYCSSLDSVRLGEGMYFLRPPPGELYGPLHLSWLLSLSRVVLWNEETFARWFSSLQPLKGAPGSCRAVGSVQQWAWGTDLKPLFPLQAFLFKSAFRYIIIYVYTFRKIRRENGTSGADL